MPPPLTQQLSSCYTTRFVAVERSEIRAVHPLTFLWRRALHQRSVQTDTLEQFLYTHCATLLNMHRQFYALPRHVATLTRLTDLPVEAMLQRGALSELRARLQERGGLQDELAGAKEYFLDLPDDTPLQLRAYHVAIRLIRTLPGTTPHTQELRCMLHPPITFPFSQLPTELACHVFSFLTARECLRIRRVSYLWSQIACTSSTWRQLKERLDLPEDRAAGTSMQVLGFLRLREWLTRGRGAFSPFAQSHPQPIPLLGLVSIQGRALVAGTPRAAAIYTLAGKLLATCRPTEGIQALTTRGEVLITASTCQIDIWDIHGSCLKTLANPSAGNPKLAVMGPSILCTSVGLVQFWNPDEGVCVRTLHAHTAEITSMLVHKERLYTGSLDRSIKAWNNDTTLANTSYDCTPPCSIASMGNWLYSADNDGDITAWNQVGHWIGSFRAHHSHCIAMTTIGDLLLTAGNDGALKVWSRMGTLLRSYSDPRLLVPTAILCCDDQIFVGSRGMILALAQSKTST